MGPFFLMSWGGVAMKRPIRLFRDATRLDASTSRDDESSGRAN
jgi:hypothetical protein